MDEVCQQRNASPEACEWSGIPAQGDLLARLPRTSQWRYRCQAIGLSFPLRLRGSGGFTPLFHASIRYELMVLLLQSAVLFVKRWQ